MANTRDRAQMWLLNIDSCWRKNIMNPGIVVSSGNSSYLGWGRRMTWVFEYKANLGNIVKPYLNAREKCLHVFQDK